MIKKYRKSKSANKNQRSFYFQDYIATNLKQKKKFINHPFLRIEFTFYSSFFFCLIAIFSLKITFVSFKKPEFF